MKTSRITRATPVLWIGNEMLRKLRCFGKDPGRADCLKQVYNHGNSLADGADAILNALTSSPYTGERCAIWELRGEDRPRTS